MRIPRGRFDDKSLAPAWLPCVEGDDKKPCRPIIRCKCGKLMGIGLHHVHADGRVTASFYHAAPAPDPCGFHEFLELEGWDGGEFPPEVRT